MKKIDKIYFIKIKYSTLQKNTVKKIKGKPQTDIKYLKNISGKNILSKMQKELFFFFSAFYPKYSRKT